MQVWLDIIVYTVLFILIFSARNLLKELKEANEELTKQRRLVISLSQELERAYQEISSLKQGNVPKQKKKIPGFLMADDPMDAITKQIGIYGR